MTIETLSDLHQSFSDLLNETALPASNDPLYQSRTRWFNRGHEDLAKRWYFKPLLKSDTIAVVAGTTTYQLPTDFEKPNGLLVFSVAGIGVVFTNSYDTSSGVLSISRNFTTGGYQVTITPTPSTSDTATIWYFATPPPLTDDGDLVLIDGDAVLYLALDNQQARKSG